MKKITIFHVFPDDKFFDSFFKFYSQLENVENRFFFYTPKKGYKFKYIKNTEQIHVINSWWTYLKELRHRDIDIVFFHGMRGKRYYYANIIRKNVKLIWWEWGFDIYKGWKNLPPLLDIELFKPKTKQFLLESSPVKRTNFIKRIVQKTSFQFYKRIQKKAVSRVDYFIPTIPIEYQLLQERHPFFRAQLTFKGRNGYCPPFIYPKALGNIQVGNSLTYTNNHLDIFEHLYGLDLADRKIYVPVSYGTGYGSADNLIRQTHFPEGTVVWMRDFMNIYDYFKHCRKITHAIFGMMRQQGLGNIYTFLGDGAKVYLYKDSIIAQQLRKDGYIFFSIEDDLNQESLSERLDEADARHNYDLYIQLQLTHKANETIKELERIVNSH